MSEQLSRVQSRQKKSRKQATEVKPSTRVNDHPTIDEPVRPTAIKPPATLSRKGRRRSSGVTPPEKGNAGEESTPSRSETYSSDRVRLSKMFVNSLIFLFVLLLGFLLTWGIKGAPPLGDLW
ncbi:hypothetical protein A8L34_04410 [Bacillus sp. FJAT-27264]|uniref:hypothetical protein n=1 Tax=Paenibacillus sp. (strain DSM 101736 / FJAT-27264) TaxID=1850362 RepID=UPI000807B73A|nr:hypothetical protein [Bacillus sp. FJAT-27264]OBZ18806.1 hypothetical protein A8L34_04410 [Bacillus sp. FJAT-27264]